MRIVNSPVPGQNPKPAQRHESFVSQLGSSGCLAN